MMTYIFDSLNEESIYAGYCDAKEGKALMEALVKMAKSKGMTFSESLELARKIMDSVYSYDNIMEQVQEDVRSAMEQVFSTLEMLEPEARLDAMNQMLFGLNMVSDDTLLEKLDGGVDPVALYRESSGKYMSSAPNAEQRLREALMRKATNLRISSKALERMGKTVADSSEYVATSAALGRKGHALKCVVAMDLYLRNQETMDVDEAVLASCETVELEAISDAVRVGEIAETTAEILTAAVTIAILVATIVLIGKCYTAGIGKVALTALQGLLAGCGTWYAGNALSRTVAEKAMLAAGYVKSGVDTFRAGIDRICSYMEAETSPVMNTEVRIPAFNVQNVEEYI